MKDIKKLLKKQANAVLPDDTVKERVRSELGLAPETEREAAYAHGGTHALQKKGILSLAAALLALVLTLCILLPVLLHGGTSVGPTPPPTLSAAGDFYAYSAASAGALLSSHTGAAASAKSSRTRFGEGAPRLDEETIRRTTDEYLRLVENLLAENAITHEAIAVPEEYAAYDYAMTITSHDLSGNAVTYTMYYSEALASEEQEEDETERAYDITGMLVTGSGAYPVRGGRLAEEETDGDESESESELWFEAVTDAQTNSYIRIEQEEEQESEEGETETERKHRLLVYENGRRTESTTIDYEQEDGEEEVHLSIVKDGQEDTLEFTRRERGGSIVLEVEADFNGSRAQFFIYIENGTYRYEFTDEREDD